MKTTRTKRSIVRAADDPLAKFAGSSQTIAASVPRALTTAIRAKIGKRGFSRFVGQALARELVDQNRVAYLAFLKRITGPSIPS